MIELVKLEEIAELTPMSSSISRLAGMVSDPDVSAADIAGVIEFDQALTVNLLRMANSAWSGSRSEITTVRAAVVRLGASRILELAVGGAVSKVMSAPCEGYELSERELWRHSVAAALAAEHLGQFVTRPVPGASFTAALVHDIGKLVLGRHLEQGLLKEILRVCEEDGIPYVEGERRVLATDHAEVGGAIARHWEFPDELVRAIAGHHDPDVHPEPVLDAVHIANAVAKLIGVGLGSEQMNMNASTDASRRLGLSESRLESLCATVATELDKTEELWESV